MKNIICGLLAFTSINAFAGSVVCTQTVHYTTSKPIEWANMTKQSPQDDSSILVSKVDGFRATVIIDTNNVGKSTAPYLIAMISKGKMNAKAVGIMAPLGQTPNGKTRLSFETTLTINETTSSTVNCSLVRN